MAKLRPEARNKNNNSSNANQIRSSHNSKKPDRWQPLRGWVTTIEKDDTDIESWTKRRKQAEIRAAKSPSRSAVSSDWQPASTSLTALCQSIEDVSAFRQQSLCEALDPLHLQRKDAKLPSKHAASQTDAAGGTPEVAVDGQDGDRNAGEVSEEGDATTSGSRQDGAAKERANEQANGNGGAVTSSVARARRLVSLSRLNDGKRSSPTEVERKVTTDPGRAEQSDAQEGHGKPDVDNRNASPNASGQNGGHVNGACAAEANGDNGESSQFADVSGEHARTVKLSYSQSNITLRNPYWTSEQQLGDATSGCKESRRFYSPEGHVIDSDRSEQKGGRINGENDVTASSEARKSATAHRQVSLVLKKVSIQQSGIPDESQKARSASTPMLPRSATRRHANGGLSAKHDVTLNHHMVPLGDLLPAVEQTIRCHVHSSSSTNHKTSPETEVDVEIYVLDKDTGTPSKDKVLTYEDSLVMMREGMELIKLKERHQSILGPPAFRPHPNKTPLQRAKENSTKRIYGQLNYTGNISYTDVNKLRWKSASGTLYNGNKNITNADAETKSAPATASSGESAEQPAFAYRSHFYGFTTAESCPDSLSAALIKAGIDPVNNLYQLSKRKKPAPGRPLGGFTAPSPSNLNSSAAAATATRLASDTLTCHITDADLGHIRGKVGTKMAEVIRRRARRAEIPDNAKS